VPEKPPAARGSLAFGREKESALRAVAVMREMIRHEDDLTNCNPLVFPDHLEVEGYRDFAIKYARGATSPSDSCGRISL
jgi:hypothetical protein